MAVISGRRFEGISVQLRFQASPKEAQTCYYGIVFVTYSHFCSTAKSSHSSCGEENGLLKVWGSKFRAWVFFVVPLLLQGRAWVEGAGLTLQKPIRTTLGCQA